METRNLIQKLEKLCDDTTRVSSIDPILEENRTVCRLINIHLRDYFDDIYIPFRMFRDGDWNLSKVLYDNEDSLFYSKRFVHDKDREIFDRVFNKYVSMIENIFDPRGLLIQYLKKWTDMSATRWKSINNQSYLKDLITNKYQIIDPSYTVTVFHGLLRKYAQVPAANQAETEERMAMIQNRMETHMDKVLANAKRTLRRFRHTYRGLIASFVYGQRGADQSHELYVKALLNCISLSIFDVVDKLIDQHVYAIHSVIDAIIEYYTPLDDIITYDPDNYDGRTLDIV